MTSCGMRPDAVSDHPEWRKPYVWYCENDWVYCRLCDVWIADGKDHFERKAAKRKKNKKHPHSAMVEYYAKFPNQWVPVPELDPDGNSSRFKEELSAEELVEIIINMDAEQKAEVAMTQHAEQQAKAAMTTVAAAANPTQGCTCSSAKAPTLDAPAAEQPALAAAPALDAPAAAKAPEVSAPAA